MSQSGGCKKPRAWECEDFTLSMGGSSVEGIFLLGECHRSPLIVLKRLRIPLCLIATPQNGGQVRQVRQATATTGEVPGIPFSGLHQ